MEKKRSTDELGGLYQVVITNGSELSLRTSIDKISRGLISSSSRKIKLTLDLI